MRKQSVMRIPCEKISSSKIRVVLCINPFEFARDSNFRGNLVYYSNGEKLKITVNREQPTNKRMNSFFDGKNLGNTWKTTPESWILIFGALNEFEFLDDSNFWRTTVYSCRWKNYSNAHLLIWTNSNRMRCKFYACISSTGDLIPDFGSVLKL